MSQEETQTKKDAIITKIEKLKKNKEDFKINVEKLFSDFKVESFNPLFDQLKVDINYKFNDYINNAEGKLSKSNDDVNTALSNLQKEIESIVKEGMESYKSLSEKLKSKIDLETAKIKGVIIEINSKLREFDFENQVDKGKELSLKKLSEPLAIGLGSIGGVTGIAIGIGIGYGLAESITAGFFFGTGFGVLGALAGGVLGLAGFGIQKLWKNFHKKEDLIELTQKAQAQFLSKYEEFLSNTRKKFDEDKKRIIDDICNSVEHYILRLETNINDLDDE
jgi:hypothetical protein